MYLALYLSDHIRAMHVMIFPVLARTLFYYTGKIIQMRSVRDEVGLIFEIIS